VEPSLRSGLREKAGMREFNYLIFPLFSFKRRGDFITEKPV
jgi:hypothetical protein